MVNFIEAANGYDKNQVDAYFEKITNEYQNVYDECVSLQDKTERLETENGELSESVQSLRAEKSESDATLAALKNEIEQIRDELEKAKSESVAASSGDEMYNALAEEAEILANRLRAEIDVLTAENHRLNGLLKEQSEAKSGDRGPFDGETVPKNRFDAITAAYISLTEEKREDKVLLSILQKENEELKNENVRLGKSVKKRLGAESEVISKALLDAEIIANQIISDAREKAMSIVEDAKVDFNKIFESRKKLLDEIDGVQRGLQNLIAQGQTFDELFTEDK
ncbi:MAG: DivIVA domain-containing protein [Clostridiales Family XIII bacterium]|jgi:cell division septum initiation protein DivIVA|nr:DivIVA domain-containing protein [Clostridiales Family XIII bacterium]